MDGKDREGIMEMRGKGREERKRGRGGWERAGKGNGKKGGRKRRKGQEEGKRREDIENCQKLHIFTKFSSLGAPVPTPSRSGINLTHTGPPSLIRHNSFSENLAD